MGDHSRSNSHDLLHILGFANVCKVCKSLLSKCYPENPIIFLKKPANKPKIEAIEDDNEFSRFKIRMPTKKHNQDREADRARHDNDDDNDNNKTSTGLSGLSRNTSYGRRSNTVTRSSLLKSKSNREAAKSAALAHTLSRSTSKGAAGPIIFSNSSGLMKPPALEKHLECTLEELCFGCIKKVTISRDVVKDNGQIVEEDETVTIRVEPGWRKGTRVTFEGKGNQRPGTEAADVIFVIAEKDHSMFKREEDDLHLAIEILLVDALAGCTISLPLLDGETTNLTVEEIVHPGYEKVVEGEGMPKQNDPGRRGNLIVNFSVKFPEVLTEDQRSRAAAILQQHC